MKIFLNKIEIIRIFKNKSNKIISNNNFKEIIIS